MTGGPVRALILAPFHPMALQLLRKRIDITYQSWIETKKLLSPEEIVESIQSNDRQILVIEADFVFDEVFAKAEKLRFLGVCRGTVNNVDVEAATRRGVLVINTPGRNAIGVAELTVGLMLSLARRIPTVNSLVQHGEWLDPVGPYISMRGVELAGKVAGIIGFGAIGAAVAKRLAAFDMKVLVYDPYVNERKIGQAGARKSGIHDLMRESDFITIHCPASPDTVGLVGKDEMALMKPTAYLVNTAAWEIVDEAALLSALEQKSIAGAAFDTFATHPISSRSPLFKLDNVILTPHIGGATDGTIERYSRMMAEDIGRFLDGRRPINLVNPEVWQEHVP